MIGRLRLRDDFRLLRTEGRVVRRPPLTVVHRVLGSVEPDGEPCVRIGYAIPRTIGPAVVRNRIRRRLRAILDDLDRSADRVPAGHFLIRVAPGAADSSFRDLEQALGEALATLADTPDDRSTRP